MTEGKTACTDCEREIRVSTAERLGGLCAPCSKLSHGAREKRQDFERRLRSGLVFAPSPAELRSARTGNDLLNRGTGWRIDHIEGDIEADHRIAPALAQPALHAAGRLFLVSDTGERLNLAYATDVAVLEYHLQGGAEHWYAYSEQNIAAGRPRVSPRAGLPLLWRRHVLVPKSLPHAAISRLRDRPRHHDRNASVPN